MPFPVLGMLGGLAGGGGGSMIPSSSSSATSGDIDQTLSSPFQVGGHGNVANGSGAAPAGLDNNVLLIAAAVVVLMFTVILIKK